MPIRSRAIANGCGAPSVAAHMVTDSATGAPPPRTTPLSLSEKLAFVAEFNGAVMLLGAADDVDVSVWLGWAHALKRSAAATADTAKGSGSFQTGSPQRCKCEDLCSTFERFAPHRLKKSY